MLGTMAFLYLPPSLPNTSSISLSISLTLNSPPRYNNNNKQLPKTHEEEPSRLVIHTLQRPNVEGLLPFYSLHVLHSPTLADGLKFQLHTLPVDAKAVADGDTLTVYVSTSEDTRESSLVPQEVQRAAGELKQALAERDCVKGDALHKQIIDAGYRVLRTDNQDILARKYRIRLRGIDAPESSMPYGKEAKDELVKIIDGTRLKILIFGEDRYGRFIGDVYCNGIFVQEALLKKGLAWHYTAYDKRPELEKWEKDARAKRVGLWASPDPEMPWEWRKNRRENRHRHVHALSLDDGHVRGTFHGHGDGHDDGLLPQ